MGQCCEKSSAAPAITPGTHAWLVGFKNAQASEYNGDEVVVLKWLDNAQTREVVPLENWLGASKDDGGRWLVDWIPEGIENTINYSLRPEKLAIIDGSKKLGPGVKVCLHGMKNKPKLNGTEGWVTRWVDDAQTSDGGRWDVHVSIDNDPLAIKPENLSLIKPVASPMVRPPEPAPEEETTSDAAPRPVVHGVVDGGDGDAIPVVFGVVVEDG